MFKKVQRESEFTSTVNELQEEVLRRQLVNGKNQLAVRPILPSDLGKKNWIWTAEEHITIPDMTYLMINGIYSASLMKVVVNELGATRMLFANGSPLSEYFILIDANSSFIVKSEFIGMYPGWPDLNAMSVLELPREFSFTGLVVDPQGYRIHLP